MLVVLMFLNFSLSPFEAAVHFSSKRMFACWLQLAKQPTYIYLSGEDVVFFHEVIFIIEKS